MKRGDRVESRSPADGRRGQTATLKVFDTEYRLWLVQYDNDRSFGWVAQSYLDLVNGTGNKAFYKPDDGEDSR